MTDDTGLTDIIKNYRRKKERMTYDNPLGSPEPDPTMSDTSEDRQNAFDERAMVRREIEEAIVRATGDLTVYVSRRQLAVKVAQHLIEKIGDWS